MLPAFRDYNRGKMVDLYGRENINTVEVIHDSYMHLIASSPFDRHKPVRLYKRFSRQLALDLRGTIALYSSLADRLLSSAVYTSELTVTGDFLEEMKDTPIFREYLHFFKTGDASVLKFVLTFLTFVKKTDLDFSDLQSSAFRDWLAIEDEMCNLVVDPELLAVMKVAVRALVDSSTFDDTLLLPKHGSGQVSEKVASIHEKFDHLMMDDVERWCFRPGRFISDHRQNLEWIKPTRKSKSARLMFVPKSYKTYRSVCMEPTSRMFFQQEVMRWLVSCMESSPISRIVDLTRQDHNQQYALWGSTHFGLDTIDLSAASDRVHTDVVKAVFPPKILYYLLGTRTSRVTLPDGRIHTLKKFAPMGSALCFPVQCIIFSAATVIGYLMQLRLWTYEDLKLNHMDLTPRDFTELVNNLSPFYKEYGKRLLSPRVYGDDIICDTRVTDHVTYLLEQLGLSVNVNKSFKGGQLVRESCGIYAYNGEDITPMLLRIKLGKSCGKDPAAFASLIAAINRAGDFGYTELHSYLISAARRIYESPSRGRFLPFTTDREAFGIWTRNKHEPQIKRENVDWQLDEERVLVIRESGRRELRQPEYLYDQWMRNKISDRSILPFGRKSGVLPRHVRLVTGWTPLRT